MRSNERRRHPRVDVAITAIVRGSDADEYAVEDLSVGGTLLRGGSLVPVGKTTRLALHFTNGEPLVADALVVRHTDHGPFGPALAVRFRGLAARQEDAIQDVMLNALETLNAPNSKRRDRSSEQPKPHSSMSMRKP